MKDASERRRQKKRTLAVDEEPEVVVGAVLLELLHGDLLGLGHVGESVCGCDGSVCKMRKV